MRVVLGVQGLARFEGWSFRYVWPTGRGFGARLDELWELHARRWPIALSRALERSFPYRDSGLEWIDDAARAVMHLADPHAARPDPPTRRPFLAGVVACPAAGGRADSPSDHGALRGYRGSSVPRGHDQVAHRRPRRDPARVAGGVVPQPDRGDPLRTSRPRAVRLGADGMPPSSGSLAGSPTAWDRPTRVPTTVAPALQAAVADLYLLAGSCHILGPHYAPTASPSWPGSSGQHRGARDVDVARVDPLQLGRRSRPSERRCGPSFGARAATDAESRR